MERTVADLESAWEKLDRPSHRGNLEGSLAPGYTSEDGPLLAIDRQDARHLLIPASPEHEAPRRPATNGLEITIDELQVGKSEPRLYFDLVCKESALSGNFTLLTLEVLKELEDESKDPAMVIERVLERWRSFLRAPSGTLSEEETIGLFGELWFLETWLGDLSHDNLLAWSGPDRDRHDFKWTKASVEAKATRARGDGPAVHRISALDQLEDPAEGQLYLFSLRATPDPIGTHSLDTSVERIRETWREEPDLVGAFDERLLTAGYVAGASPRYSEPLRITSEELYRLGPGFPRLTPASFPDGVPPGVQDIGYSLNLAACADWLVASEPSGADELLDLIA